MVPGGDRLVKALDPLLRRIAPALWWGQTMRWRILRPTVIGVKVLLLREGQVLLVRQTYLPGWHLPGGGVKRREALDEAARREASEEVGATLHELRLVGIFSDHSHGKNGYVVLFVSRNLTLRPSHDWEIAEVKFFPLGMLPGDTDPATRRRIAEFIADGEARTGDW